MVKERLKETTMRLQVLGYRKLIKNVMNVVRYMTQLFSIIITFNADIVEEPVMLNEYRNFKSNCCDANNHVIILMSPDIDVVP